VLIQFLGITNDAGYVHTNSGDRNMLKEHQHHNKVSLNDIRSHNPHSFMIFFNATCCFKTVFNFCRLLALVSVFYTVGLSFFSPHLEIRFLLPALPFLHLLCGPVLQDMIQFGWSTDTELRRYVNGILIELIQSRSFKVLGRRVNIACVNFLFVCCSCIFSFLCCCYVSNVIVSVCFAAFHGDGTGSGQYLPL